MSSFDGIAGRIDRSIDGDSTNEGKSPGQGASGVAGLSAKDLAIIATVRLFQQCTTDQLLRLFFSEAHTSPASRGVRARRTLARLYKRGHLRRLDRSLGGAFGGSYGYVYTPAGSRVRTPDYHTLDITELHVQLHDVADQFIPEDREHWLRPDAFVQVGKRIWFCEIDRGTEYKPQIKEKMKSYTRAYLKATGSFPQVVYIVTFDPLGLERRVEFIKAIASKQQIPELFWVMTMDEFVDKLKTTDGRSVV